LFSASISTARSQPDHVHRLSDRIGILARVAVNSAQDRLHSRSGQALRGNNVLCGDDIIVETNPESHLGQVGVAADGLDELVAGT